MSIGRRAALTTALALSLGGCGGGAPVDATVPAAARLESTSQAALGAFQAGQYERAAGLYGQALGIAALRDDSAAIVDAEYNAAVSLLMLDRLDEADALVERARGEVERSRIAEPDALRLLQATLRYRQGRLGEADALAAQIAASAADPATVQRAEFLRGLIAAESSDAAGVRRAADALDGDDERLAPDRAELAAWLARLEGRYDDATAAFTETARLRSDANDFRGTVRALTAAGETAERAGHPDEAAASYLRAGRSALEQGDSARARDLLTLARALAEGAGDAGTAREAGLYLARIGDG